MPKRNDSGITDDKVVEIVKKKRNRPDLANFGQEYVEPGDNAKYIQFAMASMKAPKIDFNDVKAVQERIEWYFTRCFENDMKPGVVGLANALGVDRKTLWSWKTGERRGANEALVDTIKKAYVFLEELWEQYMQNGKISPPNGIFLGKNNFDYKDVADVVVTPNNPYQAASEDDLKEKYLTDMPSDDE